MNTKEIRSLLEKQLAADYNCRVEDFSNTETLVTVMTDSKTARKWEDRGIMHLLSYRGKLVITARADILDWCKNTLAENISAEWGFEANTLVAISNKLRDWGYGINQAHLFFAPLGQIPEAELPIKLIEQDEIAAFEDDERIDEAFLFSDTIEDVLGAAIYDDDGELLSIAGASHNSELMWELGLNSIEEGKGYGIAALSALARETLNRGHIPFCGTALSHLASQRVMLGSGFVPTFCELTTEKLDD